MGDFTRKFKWNLLLKSPVVEKAFFAMESIFLLLDLSFFIETFLSASLRSNWTELIWRTWPESLFSLKSNLTPKRLASPLLTTEIFSQFLDFYWEATAKRVLCISMKYFTVGWKSLTTFGKFFLVSAI